MSADLNTVKGTVVFYIAVMFALCDGTFDTFVGISVVHSRNPLYNLTF